MDKMKSFEQAASLVLSKYKDTALVPRWQEAIAFGKGKKAESYWIRDSEDVVNIVWLNSDGIRDITWHSPSRESMFNFVPLKSIITLVVREKENIALQLLHVTGNLLVHVITRETIGDIWWVAHNEESKQQLHAFLASVMNSYTKAVR